jgi:hypothetical protein
MLPAIVRDAAFLSQDAASADYWRATPVHVDKI